MNITRTQFTILSNLAHLQKEYSDMECFVGHGQKMNDEAMRDLIASGYVAQGRITKTGFKIIEPYSAKRAIFLAAGLGSRLAPITINTPKPLVRVHGIRIIDHLIDACLAADISEIYIVRGYLAEQFDQLLYKYPTIKFLENPMYSEANNIGSAFIARELLSNAYVMEADLLLSNPKIITKYHYSSDFLAIKKEHTADWCFETENGVIVEQKLGGDNCWQMVGISYWNEEDGRNLSEDIASVYSHPEGKNRYWEQVPLRDRKENYAVEVRECIDNDVVEIDTFDELKAIDKNYGA